MNITQTISWQAATWPASTPAQNYAIFQVYPGVQTLVTTTATNSVSLSFDDTAALAYQVRPTDGTTYGPEAFVFVVNYVPCRAWLRNIIRTALYDRIDSANASVYWPDDELNVYIGEGITELNLLFPIEEDTVISLLPPTNVGGISMGVRDYLLPTDFFRIWTVQYVTADARLQKYLIEKPWRGGESTATSYLGYPKLGIITSPMAGRYYVGHFDVYEGGIHLDWDPNGDGDYLKIRYLGRRPQPSSDAAILPLNQEDLELLSLYVQMKAWMRIEGQDTKLSRWRTREDGGKRDDMPTVRHSAVIRSLYNEACNNRRELRPRSSFRLTRR